MYCMGVFGSESGYFHLHWTWLTRVEQNEKSEAFDEIHFDFKQSIVNFDILQ